MAEKALFDSLKNHLDDEYFVYYRLRYHMPRRAKEGEIDFLVLHREHGLLVIECKGLGIRRDGQGRWWRQLERGVEEPMKQSPWEQAQGQVHDLWGLLQDRMPATFPDGRDIPLVYGHAAAFPRVRAGDERLLPLDVDRGLVIDADDLPRIHQVILRLLAHWQKGRNRVPFTPSEFKRFRRGVLHPTLQLVPTLGARIAADDEAFTRLDRQQSEILGMVLGNKRLRVTGGAGTGKTLLAFEAVRRLAARGARVLFLCFNRPLAELAIQAIPAGTDGPVQAANFHRLCAVSAELRGLEFVVPVPTDQIAAQRFWECEAPTHLLDALADGLLQRFDAVVVDEGQDFHASWWELIRELLVSPDHGHLVVFEDPRQEIFGRKSAVPAGFSTLTLERNYRNTRCIAELVAKLGSADTSSHPDCPEGEAPTILPLGTPVRNLEKMAELVEHLVEKGQVRPDQIVVLTPRSRKNSSLANQENLGPYPLSDDPSRREGKILHATIGRFKGLESDIVILCDVDPKDPRCNRNALYVAASRAKHALWILARPDWLQNPV
jgi:hypothetical protein